MKRVVWILATGLLVAAGNLFAARVTDVELSYVDKATVARIHVDGPIRFIHQTEVPKDGKPYRVIVDVLSAVHGLGAKDFTDLPKCPILRVRSSQYSAEPEKIVRLVFDMARLVLYQVKVDGGTIVVTFPDETIKPFAPWSSAQWLAKATESGKGSRTSQPTASTPTVAEKNRAVEKDRLASLTETTGQTDPEASKSDKGSKQSGAAKMFSTAELRDGQSGRAAEVASKPAAETAAKTPAQPASASSRSPGPAAPGKSPDAPTAQQKSEKSKSQVPPEALKSSASTQSSGTRVEAKQSKSESATKKTTRAEGSKQAAPTQTVKSGKSTPTAAQAKAAPKPTVQTAQAEETSTVSKTRPTSRFRRTPAKIRGTMVAEFPKRLVIKYRPKLPRDPFQSLITEAVTHRGPIEVMTPSVEGLKLVGVIEADAGSNRALFEDKQGYSYILKSGDKVKKGYVLRVENDRVYFQIFEYGWSRTVALALEDF